MTQKTYNADSITVLKGLEPVKQRPGMYTRTENPLHVIQEVIDNAADEALAGHGQRIDLTLKSRDQPLAEQRRQFSRKGCVRRQFQLRQLLLAGRQYERRCQQEVQPGRHIRKKLENVRPQLARC